MRFKRGSKVEVMNKQEVPISWRSAEILNGNGHTYYVRYEYHPVMNNRSMMERVSRKFVRPCPLPSQGIETWKVGDTVEVFEDFSWKIATILTVMQGDYYTVRLLGSSKESNIHKLNIREQWLWLDDKWILMGKKSGACGVNQVNKQSSLNYYEKTSFQAAKFNAGTHTEAQKNCLDIEKRNGLQEFHKLSRSLKRLSQDSSCVIESLTGKAYKIRAVEKDYRKQKVAPPSLVEKVDFVASPKESLGEINTRASFDNRMIGYNEPKRENLDGAAGSYLARSLESRDSESSDFDIDASSVGSCSVNSERQRRFPYRLAQIPFQVTDSVCSDAESFCGSTDKEESCSLSLPLEEEVATSIHNLELHAYRCTLEALHASGPLSWDQETLLTNLRMMLNISNDEHLMELRNLLSDDVGKLFQVMVVPLARDSDVMFVTKSHVTSLQHWCKINFSHYDRTIQHYLTQIGSIHFSSISLSTLTELQVTWLPCPTDEANYDKFVVAGACLGASTKMADVEICCYHGYIGVLSRLTGEFQEAPHSSVVHEEDISETVQIKMLDIFLWLYSWKHSTRT